MADTPLSPRDERLSAFLASIPPRHVPADYTKSALAQSAPLAPALVIGFFGLVSLALAVAFFPRHLVEDWQVSRSVALTAPGRILKAETTGLSENHRRVMRYAFSYAPAKGTLLIGTCYTTGAFFRGGEEVTVRYLPRNESIACPVGARLSATGPLAALVAIFPLFSAVFVIVTVGARQEVKRILVQGELLEARVVGLGTPFDVASKTKKNEIKLECDGVIFSVPCYRVSLADFIRERLDSNTKVFILRDPARPRKVLFPERF